MTTIASLTRLLGTEWPLIQAPMAGAQGSAMALAVCEAGALGSLPAALLAPQALQDELTRLRAGTTRPFNVNFFCHAAPQADAAQLAAWQAALQPWHAELGATAGDPGATRHAFDAEAADRLAPFRPSVVSFHFGLPAAPLLARVKGWGARVLSSATTVEEATWLVERGVDAVIAQGLEAGGHRGHFLDDDLTRQSGTFALLPQVVAAVGHRVPVIAAGGIADAEGVAAALALGAAGVQVGTAYLLCPEATIAAPHRAALQDPARRGHTALTRVFTGRPARGIVNRAMREITADPPPFPLAGGAMAPLRAAAEARGSGEFSPLWAGQNTLGCRAVGAAEVTRALIEGFSR